MPYISVGSCHVHYEDVPWDLPVDVIFIHGNLAANLWWQPCLEFFPKSQGAHKGKRALLIEWRGCGRTGPVKNKHELNVSRMARDILCVIEELCTDPVVVVGHSTGGLLALKAMALCPNLFKGALLLAPLHPRGIVPSDKIRLNFLTMRDDDEYCANVMATTIKDVARDSSLFRDIVSSAKRALPFLWEGIVDALAQPDLESLLFRINHPVWIFHGDEDPVLPFADSAELAERLAFATFRLQPNTGHSYNLEQPEAFALDLLAFIKSLSVH